MTPSEGAKDGTVWIPLLPSGGLGQFSACRHRAPVSAPPSHRVLSLGLHMALSLHVCVHISLFYKDPSHIGLGTIGEGDGTPLQYSRLENPMGRGAW